MNDDENRRQMKLIASYITLPFILGIPPIVGWFIGSWIDKKFEIAPLGSYVLLALGFIAGARECYRIITTFKEM